MSRYQVAYPQHLLNPPHQVLAGFIFKLLVWFRKYGKQLIVGTVAVLVLAVVCQLVYPKNRALPLMYLDGKLVGTQSKQQINNEFSKLSNSKLSISIGKTTYSPTLKELGVSFTPDATATDYPLTARLIPFSLLFYGQTRLDDHVKTHFDETTARKYFAGVIEKNTKSVVEGSITIKDQKVVVSYPQSGLAYDSNQIIDELRKIEFLSSNGFNVPTSTTAPLYSHTAFEKAGNQAEAYLAKEIEVNAQGKSITLTRETIEKSLRIKADPTSKSIIVDFERAVLLTALEPLADKLFVSPVHAQVTTLDGAETGRIGGADGQALAYEPTIDNVINTVRQSNSTAGAEVQPLRPIARTNRMYSNTSNGLQTLLNDWINDYRGPKWGVVVKELNGQSRYAAYQPDKPYFSASVYKLFLAYPVLSDVANASLNPAALTSTGKSVDACIDQMIVISSNGCAHALGDMIGWDNATSRIHSKGFGLTKLSSNTGFTTTASDTTRILEQLYRGTLLPSAQNTRLLDMMKRQIWRTGIPAGSKGIVVADKPGYVPGYVHDVAIVYHPKGAYTVSVFSTNGSYSQIVNLVTRLNTYFYQ